jgi:hypothetical protein
MFDHTIDLTEPGTAEAMRRLEAYVDLRLSPSVTATTRMRMNVMNAAHRRAALVAADADAASSAATPLARPADPTRSRRNAWRRTGSVLLAASMTLGIVVGTASAAKAGGPLYGARLFAEMAVLPADPMARAEAELARLDERVREIQQASSEGDSAAVQAALAAYSAIVAEAETASDGDAAASAAIGAGVARHVAVLTGLIATVPAAARDALQHALVSSTKALQDFGVNGGGNTAPGGTTAPGGNAARPAGGHVDNGEPAKSGQPEKPAPTTDPVKSAVSPKPDKPGPTNQPARPEKTATPEKPAGSSGPSAQDPQGDQ